MHKIIRIKIYLSALFVLLLMCRCTHESKTPCGDDGDTIRMKYAKNITIIRYDDRYHVELINPWDTTKTLNTYDITEPFKRTAVYSAVHCSLIDELNEFDKIAAICDLEYIHMDKIHKGVENGTIADIGNSMAPNIEKIIDCNPDAILLSPFENSGGYGQIEKLGIPIIECADYMEISPLARAEWIKFYGILYGCYEKSCTMFDSIEQKYLALKDSCIQYQKNKKTLQPSITLDMVTSSTWYVPGGNSTIGILMKDACGDYVFKERKENGSLALSPETVFDKSYDADIWVIRYTKPQDFTYSTLSKENPAYSKMKAFKQHNTYGCNLQYVAFFEETPFHPDRLLKDFIKIIHPDILPDYNLRYYKKIKE